MRTPLLAVLALFLTGQLAAQAGNSPGCDLSVAPGYLWSGTDPEMPVSRLAALVAPIFWFSPDEPLNEGREGPDLRMPEAFPFETAPDAPVVYYQIEELRQRGIDGDPVIVRDPSDPGRSVINLDRAVTITISFYAYFHSEEGLGAHPHDIEPVEFRVAALNSNDERVRDRVSCSQKSYLLIVSRTAAKAHGLRWYWNVLETDDYTRFPMTILVEEGKHGLSTDKNGDGYFTPGFDVNQQINDAWGVRDVIRQGSLLSGKYEGWMTKVRTPPFRVFPPLPDDSPLQPALEKIKGDDPYATYELRPLPPMSAAEGDKVLAHLFKGKAVEDWPEVGSIETVKAFDEWKEQGNALKTLSIAYRYDGTSGFSFVFPFFIVKNLEEPMTGGYIVQRMYFRDGVRDFGWMAMYTPSASRWIDSYFAAGVEWDKEMSGGKEVTNDHFVLETGIKFRAQIGHSPLKFLSFLTDFWGVRAGIKNAGAFNIDNLTYVLEVGAGAW
jgi:hypothetical protein